MKNTKRSGSGPVSGCQGVEWGRAKRVELTTLIALTISEFCGFESVLRERASTMYLSPGTK